MKNNIILVNNIEGTAEGSGEKPGTLSKSASKKPQKPRENLSVTNKSPTESDSYEESIESSENVESTLNEAQIIYPEYSKDVNYYKEFWKIYLKNEMMIQKLVEFVAQIKEIKARIQLIEGSLKEFEDLHSGNNGNKVKKKNRRTAAEISKEYTCPYEGCGKSYGSDVSLNLHIKIKHNGGNKTEREKLVKNFLIAKNQGQESMDLPLNLPPGYIENFENSKTKSKKRKKNSSGKGNSPDKRSSSKSQTDAKSEN